MPILASTLVRYRCGSTLWRSQLAISDHSRAWFLPPYSPDFNPIEQAWSQAKSWLRSKSSPTFDTLVDSIGDALRRVTPEHCRNYFINSGCGVTPKNKPL
ncbi:MAG: transposase [Planctomycetota bacterium]